METTVSIAVWSFRLQDRILEEWARETERTGMLRERLTTVAQRYRDLLQAQRS
jgi:hypothetical protein